MKVADSTQHTADSVIPRSVEPLLRKIGRMASAEGMSAYAVGGCVRDWRLGRARTVDIDITVEGDGLALARRAASALGGALTEHQQFGTATIVVQHTAHSRQQTARAEIRIDVATCRRETYAKPAAYPKVSRGTIHEDLFRRDFTINAMAAAIAPEAFGRLVDPFGGVGDLRRRRLRILHGGSFRDDPSRILRGVRFAQRFGLRWEPATRAAALAAVREGLLGRLNTGRLAKELDRMCDEPDPRACFEAFAELLNQEPTTQNPERI
ncbi:MAG: CCA tRNA nucleotidyltransferase [Candidatus Omnitrophica bacterium]|nr:CCA tRNA nucleotidyltransferase [Candidatus Omnitrophota bacterium]